MIPLAGKCRANDIIYKCIASATGFPNKVYLETPQEEFKKRFYNHNTSLKNESKRNDTTLAKYIRDLKYNVAPTLKWYILYKCILCLQKEIQNTVIPKPR